MACQLIRLNSKYQLKTFLIICILIGASQLECGAQSLYNNTKMFVGKIEYSSIVRDMSMMNPQGKLSCLFF